MCSHVVDLSCCCISDSTEYNILVSQSSADGLSEFSALEISLKIEERFEVTLAVPPRSPVLVPEAILSKQAVSMLAAMSM